MGNLKETPEGWGDIAPGDRKAHYYRNAMALCRRRGLYMGPLTPDEFESPDDCGACRKILNKEKKK